MMKVELVHGANGSALYLDDLHVAGVQPYGYIMTDFEADLDETKVSEIFDLCKNNILSVSGSTHKSCVSLIEELKERVPKMTFESYEDQEMITDSIDMLQRLLSELSVLQMSETETKRAEGGKTVQFPCDVGEKLWVLHRLTKIPIQVVVESYRYAGSCTYVQYRDDYDSHCVILGRGIFATREEAVKSLSESSTENPFVEPARELVDMMNAGTLPVGFDLEKAACDPAFTRLLYTKSAREAAVEYSKRVSHNE